MKTLPAVAGSLGGLLAVRSLPGPEPPVAPAPARGHGFAWNQDAFWRSLEKTYGDARAVGCRAADPVAARELSALGSTADRLLGAPLDPGAAVLDSVERRFFTLAPLVAACPRHLGDYVRLSGRLREAIKWQSRRWDVAGDAARARLYRSLYGLRGAVEEVMLHHPDSVTALLDVGAHRPRQRLPRQFLAHRVGARGQRVARRVCDRSPHRARRGRVHRGRVPGRQEAADHGAAAAGRSAAARPRPAAAAPGRGARA